MAEFCRKEWSKYHIRVSASYESVRVDIRGKTIKFKIPPEYTNFNETLCKSLTDDEKRMGRGSLFPEELRVVIEGMIATPADYTN